MTSPTKLTATGLKKVFNRRVIFEQISFSISESETLLVTGRNGAGKSTLVKILCGLLTPTAGTVSVGSENRLPEPERLLRVGMVSPYLQMYDEFSAEENLRLALALRGLPPDEGKAAVLLEAVGLGTRKKDPVRTYSSGMKQRVKYAFATVHSPRILFLDEPMANLDGEGVAMVRDLMDRQRRYGILVVATNDLSDADHFDQQVNLDAGTTR